MKKHFTIYPKNYVRASSGLNSDYETKIKEFIAEIKQQPEMKNLYPYTWTSGSSTQVYPISVWQDSIDLQWDSDREPKRFIQRMEQLGKELGIVKYGSWVKSDGSCPNYVRFRLNRYRF